LPPNLQEKARAIISPWFSAPGPVRIDPERRSEALLAGATGIEFIPALAENPEFTSGTPEGWASEVAYALDSLGLRALVTTLAMPYGYEPLTAALEREGFGIILVRPARQAMQLEPEKLRQITETMLIDGPEAQARAVLERLLHFLPPGRLIIRLEKLGPLPPGVKASLKYEPPQGRSS
jgi:hypothetical protein